MPKVLVGCPSSLYPSRTNLFYDCFANLIVPDDGSKKKRYVGDAFANIDNMTKDALENGYEYLCFIDDDEIFDNDLVINLLKHDLDVVSGLYLMKGWPFKPCHFDRVVNRLGFVNWMELKDKPGLVQIQSTGMGCFLIKTECYKKLQHPYYRFEVRAGQRFGCDVLFCEDLRNAGYKIYLDTTQTIWHKVDGFVFPRYVNGEWKSIVRIGEGELNIDTYKELTYLKEKEVLV